MTILDLSPSRWLKMSSTKPSKISESKNDIIIGCRCFKEEKCKVSCSQLETSQVQATTLPLMGAKFSGERV